MSQGKKGTADYRVMDDSYAKCMLYMWQGGASHRQLAQVFNTSPGTVRNELKRRGAADIERNEGRMHAKGDSTVLGGLGKEVVARMNELGLNATQLSWYAQVDTYQVDEIIHAASQGRVWCPPIKDYFKLFDFLWGRWGVKE